MMANPIAKTASALLLCGALLLAPAVAQQPPESPVDQALSLAADEQYAEALAVINTMADTEQQSYEARFAKARILAWSGSYNEADSVYSALEADYPNDPDILVAHGYLAYYQGRYAAAEERFEKVLAVYPDYVDASDGLHRVRYARFQPDDLAPAEKQYRLDLGTEVSTFSRSDNEDWQQSFVQVSRLDGRRIGYIRADHYSRFDLDDTEISAGINVPLGGKWDAGLIVRTTPDADFRPETGVSLEAGRRFDFKGSAIAAIRLMAQYRLDRYETAGDIQTFVPGADIYAENGVSLHARLFSTESELEGTQYGGLVRGVVPVTEKARLTAGVADAPEAVAGVVVRTRTVFGGVKYILSDDLAIRLDVARDDRENSYIRESVSVSLTKQL